MRHITETSNCCSNAAAVMHDIEWVPSSTWKTIMPSHEAPPSGRPENLGAGKVSPRPEGTPESTAHKAYNSNGTDNRTANAKHVSMQVEMNMNIKRMKANNEMQHMTNMAMVRCTSGANINQHSMVMGSHFFTFVGSRRAQSNWSNSNWILAVRLTAGGV
jgi:hypothetical protein